MAHGSWLMAYGLWLMAYGFWLMAHDVVGDAQRLGGNGQTRVHRRGRWEERGVHDEQVLDVMGAAQRVEHGRAWIGAEAQRSALVRRVPVSVGVLHHEPEAEPPQDPLRFLDESP